MYLLGSHVYPSPTMSPPHPSSRHANLHDLVTFGYSVLPLACFPLVTPCTSLARRYHNYRSLHCAGLATDLTHQPSITHRPRPQATAITYAHRIPSSHRTVSSRSQSKPCLMHDINRTNHVHLESTNIPRMLHARDETRLKHRDRAQALVNNRVLGTGVLRMRAERPMDGERL
jgi:hypothetical protein